MAFNRQEYIDKIKKSVNEMKYEIMLYFMINTIGGQLFYFRHDSADGRFTPTTEDFEIEDAMREVISWCVSQTTRFGLKKPQEGPKNAGTPEYWAWFRYWDSYVKGLSQEDWQKLDKACSSGEDLTDYRPADKWQDHIAEEEERARKSAEFAKKYGL